MVTAAAFHSSSRTSLLAPYSSPLKWGPKSSSGNGDLRLREARVRHRVPSWLHQRTPDLLHLTLDSGYFLTSGVEESCNIWSRDLGYHHPINVRVRSLGSSDPVSATFPRLSYTTEKHVGSTITDKTDTLCHPAWLLVARGFVPKWLCSEGKSFLLLSARRENVARAPTVGLHPQTPLSPLN